MFCLNASSFLNIFFIYFCPFYRKNKNKKLISLFVRFFFGELRRNIKKTQLYLEEFIFYSFLYKFISILLLFKKTYIFKNNPKSKIPSIKTYLQKVKHEINILIWKRFIISEENTLLKISVFWQVYIHLQHKPIYSVICTEFSNEQIKIVIFHQTPVHL